MTIRLLTRLGLEEFQAVAAATGARMILSTRATASIEQAWLGRRSPA